MERMCNESSEYNYIIENFVKRYYNISWEKIPKLEDQHEVKLCKLHHRKSNWKYLKVEEPIRMKGDDANIKTIRN